MPFKLISRPDPAPMSFLVTNATALAYGQCVRFVSGRLSPCGPTDPVAAVTVQAVTAGTNVSCRVLLVEPEQTWEADYTGTPIAGFILGVTTATLDADGRNINSANVTGGPCSVIGIQTVGTKALVKFRARQLT